MQNDTYREPGSYFWSATPEELKKGYSIKNKSCQCLICGESFLTGEVYPHNGHYYEASARTAIHIQEVHSSMLDTLLQYPPDFLGVTEIQRSILLLIAEGLTDKEIAARKGISPSTIRSHRFKFREKERQARIFLTVMSLINENQMQTVDEEFCTIPSTASMRDDRYMTTEAERQQILDIYFDENGHLKECPAKEKKKLIVLRQIISNFKSGTRYTEREINRIIERIYDDYPYIRRLLIEYGFLDRTASGSEYWVKE